MSYETYWLESFEEPKGEALKRLESFSLVLTQPNMISCAVFENVIREDSPDGFLKGKNTW